MAERLTKAQREMLTRYAGSGVTSQSFGSMVTFRSLVQIGFLRRTYGVGMIEAEITNSGRQALRTSDGGKDA